MTNSGIRPWVFVALLALGATAQAATVSFTFTVSGGATLPGLMGPPPVGTPIDVMLSATGSFAPFGTATYTESGLITFNVFPSGGFGPASVTNNFIASFDGGADTFSGTNVFQFSPPDITGFQTTTNTMTILGGTGIFAGASGFATGTGTNSPPPPGQSSPVFFSGGGQITAPGLTAVPEPISTLLVGAGLVSIVGLRKRRRSHGLL